MAQKRRGLGRGLQALIPEAQAEVPQALAQALREGKLGVMDYYNMNNILADTGMRENIAKSSPVSIKPEEPKR